ncbi:prepilin-type N-terminal cleavage/methylation domain-containing protein [Seongchinamella sediminis]|uniref:prepilin-type N-terminal cleavage/methylation domain-containing protein n=1 Tax=Seongchinamella sediminis TaxID=2283635 RepID=UPI0013C33C74|nr:prepilin-type N-terminal cleavage/methylation domain-containing protein [Seongchinamella sediminis]
MSAANGQRGFTLVEVMVALTILSMVLLGTVTGMRTLGNTQASIERATARVDEIRTVSGFLRQLMESAVVGAGKGGLTLGGGTLEATYFRLGAGFVEWKTNLLFGEAYGGVHLVRIAADEGQLMLRWLEPERVQPDEERWRAAPARPLVNDLEGFTLQVREEFQADWTENWEESATAPALVRLQIKSSGRYWPDLIMQVQR